MADEFKPNHRQRALIDAAIAATKRARVSGHPAPVELVRRMTLEGALLHSAPDSELHEDRRWQHQFHFEIELVFSEAPPPLDLIAARLADAGCLRVGPFEGQGGAERSLCLHFEVWAPSGEAALRAAFTRSQEAFPGVMVGKFGRPIPRGVDASEEVVRRADDVAAGSAINELHESDFRVTICAAVQMTLPTEVMLRLLSPAGCDAATCFERRPSVFIGEFVRCAASQEEADATALDAVRGLFQDARLMNLEPAPGSTLDALTMLAKERWRSAEAVKSAAAKLEELEPDTCDHPTTDAEVSFTWAAGRVIEVLEDIQVAHIRMDDGRILSLWPRTLGLASSLGKQMVGQRFRCLLDLQVGIVEWAEPLVERPDVDEPRHESRQGIVGLSAKLQRLFRRRS